MSKKPITPDVPRWLPTALYAVLTAFLFREFVLTDRMLFGGDTMGLGYVARDLYAQALSSLGRVPGWAPHILGGTPFLEALSAGDSLYPPSVLLLLLTETYRALGWKLVLHVFASGLFFFGWTRSIGCSRAAALLGGTAYLLAPFLIGFVHPGHDGKIFVTALAPLLFWVTERHYARPSSGSFAAIGLVVALVMFTTHFQMAYFLFGSAGLYAIFRAVQIGRGTDEVVTEVGAADGPDSEDAASAGPSAGGTRAGAVRFGLFMAAAVLGAAGSAYQFVPAIEYVTEHSRRVQTTREAAGESGRAWSSSWSLHPEEVVSLVVPEFVGNAAGGPAWAEGTYWGRNFTRDNHSYAGIVVLLLAALSFVGARRKQLRWFFAVLGLLAVGFALGAHSPIWSIFYAVLPGIRLFRAPDMVMYLFGFGAITLASLGVDRIFDLAAEGPPEEGGKKGEGQVTPHQTARRVALGGVGVVGVLALLMGSGAFTSFWTSVVYSSIDARRLQILQAHLPNIAQGAFIALLLTAAAAGLVWALLDRRIPAIAGLVGLLALVAVDAARIDRAFIETVDFHQWAAADANIRAILERENTDDPYRLLSLAGRGQDVTPAMHGIELAAGHHPNDLSRYRELIGMVGSGLPENLLHPNVRQILNVRYILWPDIELGPAPQGPVISRTQLAGGQTYHTLLADQGLPRARLVGAATVKGDDEAVAYILSEAHDPSVEAVLAQAPPVELSGGPVEGSVRWIEREADVVAFEVVSDRPALLVVADNW
ncbi:MAG: hypothetical protein KJO65_00225, partial [Gemmatimonadetes bacterium]|nr:hypothetical protein [Gemmatimonadota bacterium]